MAVSEDLGELTIRPPRIPPTLSSFTLAIVVLLLTCGIAWFLYGQARDALVSEVRMGLQRSATLAAQRVDGDAHARLLAPGARKDTPDYELQNRAMHELAAVDPEIAYAYTAVERDGQVWLVLDTEPPDGLDDMAVLQPYEDAPEDLRTAIRERRALISAKPYTDQWGTFISAYVPFANREGSFAGIVGVDLKLTDYERRLKPMRQATLMTYLAGIIISSLIGLGLWWSYRRSSAVEQLGRQLNNVNALLNVSKALGSNVGLDNLLPTIVGKTSAVMRAERSSLFLYDKAKKVLIGRVTEGMEAGREFLIPDDRGIAGRVARTGQVANVADPRQDPDFDDAFDRQTGFTTRAILTVPIVDVKGVVLGVLQALNPKDNQPFDHNDEVMLAALAGQAAIALERERLNQSAQERRKLEEALRFAQSIQLGMLPHKFPDPDSTGVELHAELIPAKMVGGDFYDFVWIDDDHLGLVVADVSGKGIPAALLMAKAMTMIRAYLGATRDPAKALAQANEELAEDNDAAMFVTAFAAIYDRRKRELVYSNAGHNEPYVLRAGQIHALGKAKSVPLGAQSGIRFDNAGARLAQGDVLFLYTDGVSEAMDLDYQEYGEQRLRQFLVEHVDRPMPELTRACIDSVRTFARGAEQSDDITVLVMRVGEAPAGEGGALAS